MSNPFYLRLSCAVQNYAWGKVGIESEVAQLKVGGDHADPDGFQVDSNEHYAELWMGTHKKGSAVITHPRLHTGLQLGDWLKSNQWALGEHVVNKFSGHLPFILKVLSIDRALSIQAHPTKPHAEQLYASSPDKYPDPNHKPELAIAMSDFEGFCGFRPFREIQTFVSCVHELRNVIGQENCDLMVNFSDDGNKQGCKSVLKSVFTALMSCNVERVSRELNSLAERLTTSDVAEVPSQEKHLLLRLNTQFPGDIGCFCVFFLNFLHLNPGEALYLAPNEPHAYISGDIVECMACSDNVVRAGLTLKFRDKDTLCQMLSYEMRSPQESMFQPHKHPALPNALLYDPPTPEFAVAKITIAAGTKELVIPPVSGPSIFLVVSGSMDVACNGMRETIGKGVSIFLPADAPICLLPKLDEEMLVFQAFCSE